MALDMARDETLTLRSGGLAYQGWKTVRVQRSMEQCAGGFEVSVSERWAGQDTARELLAGQSCEVLMGEEPVITGFIDGVEKSMDPTTHEVRVIGRDATADLVDCSAIRKTGQWRGLRVQDIAAELAEPFGVPVRVDYGVDTGKPLQSFALQEGETVFCAVERAARMRGVLLTTDGLGALVITRAGLAKFATPLKLGANILSMRARVDHRDRFSRYIAKGQMAGVYLQQASADAKARVAQTASQVSAIATDPGVLRYRPMVLLAECQDVAASLKDRVQWEASVRAARSLEFEVEVQGWFAEDGLWEPNFVVWLDAPELGVSADLLITSVTYTLDEGGRKAVLSLTRTDAYSVLPMKEVAAPANYLTKKAATG